jgi:hypothetical protein
MLFTSIKSRVERIEISKDGKEFSLKLRVMDPNNPVMGWWSIRELNP